MSCEHQKTKTTSTAPVTQGELIGAVRRRKLCCACGLRFTEYTTVGGDTHTMSSAKSRTVRAMAQQGVLLERDVRAALKKRVETYGGEVRAVKWLGRPHAPDVMALIPCTSGTEETGWNPAGAQHPFIETKAPGGACRPGQLREHDRMRAAGCTVLVITTLAELDAWLPAP